MAAACAYIIIVAAAAAAAAAESLNEICLTLEVCQDQAGDSATTLSKDFTVFTLP